MEDLMRNFAKVIVSFILCAGLATLVSGTASAATGKTLNNLMTAFNGESNAHVKYLAFAKRAEGDGFGEVASLFRAAARAEEIHAANHAEVIRKMGGNPKADIKSAEIRTTKENLEEAIKGETYEKNTMYPEFIATAKAEAMNDAVRSFNFAKYAENEHARLYAEALAKLGSLKGSKGKDYFVCQICGNTVAVVDFQKCPSCRQPKDKYVKVS
jgi:rubrerythrin